MPKLSKKKAKAVESAEITGGDFPLIEPGLYVARLREVAVAEGRYAPRWTAEFEEIHDLDGNKVPGRQWYGMNVPDDGPAPDDYPNGDAKWQQFQRMSNGNLHGFFEAFGYTTDSDTDEMIGEWAAIQIGIRTADGGAKKGQKVNQVKTVLPVPDDVDPSEFEDADSDDTF